MNVMPQKSNTQKTSPLRVVDYKSFMPANQNGNNKLRRNIMSNKVASLITNESNIIKKPFNEQVEVTLNHLKTDPDQEPMKGKKVIFQQ